MHRDNIGLKYYEYPSDGCTVEKLTALMTLIFVRVIQTIIVPVANVNSRNAVAVVAREQIAEACSAFGLAVTRRFIASVQTVVVSVTVPSGWNTPGQRICV